MEYTTFAPGGMVYGGANRGYSHTNGGYHNLFGGSAYNGNQIGSTTLFSGGNVYVPQGTIIPSFNSSANSFFGQIINDALNKLLILIVNQKTDTANGKKENVITKAKKGLSKLTGKLSEALNK